LRLTVPLLPGRFVRRYKRFFVDVRLDSGPELAVHCPNSGSMSGLLVAGAPVLVSDSGNPARKLRHTLERIRPGRAWVGVNTMLPNHLVREAVERGRVRELRGFASVRSEVRLGGRSRIDLLLEGRRRKRCWVEVKNATLRDGRVARFPDAVTERGRKHLRELSGAVARGDRAAMFYVVNRADCDAMGPADDIDPAYGEALRRAASAGVELLAYRVAMRGARSWIATPLPVLL
jgi:sugar fermentation stimulation protein A